MYYHVVIVMYNHIPYISNQLLGVKFKLSDREKLSQF